MRAGAEEMLAELCAAEAGLRLGPEAAAWLAPRLAALARSEGFGSVDHLLDAVRDGEDRKLMRRTVEALAPAPAGFFAQPALIDHLCDVALPDLAQRRPDNRLRIWAAHCGAGQEVYSLAMALEERSPRLNVEIFASGLSDTQLEKAQAGLYTGFEVQNGLSARRLVRCFERRGDAFALSPRLRGAIRWGRFSLMEDPARLGRFDLILCRGLLPALTDLGRVRAAGTLAIALRPDGILALGPDEAAPDARWRAAAGPRGAFALTHPAVLAA